jgi:hypothetical protein
MSTSERCQPVWTHQRYGSLIFRSDDPDQQCRTVRRWYLFHRQASKLVLQLTNPSDGTDRSTYLFNIYSMVNKKPTILFDSITATAFNRPFELDLTENASPILLETVVLHRTQLTNHSISIDYTFENTSSIPQKCSVTHSIDRFSVAVFL